MIQKPIDRFVEYMEFRGLNDNRVTKQCKLSRNLIGQARKQHRNIHETTINKLLDGYPDINPDWLWNGNEPMLKKDLKQGYPEKPIKIIEDNIRPITVPLLPISSLCGRIDDFMKFIKQKDCEKLISPIRGADLAITISGESMAPEYPNGSKVLVKKISKKTFIEWGRCYVLDTCNGTVIKKLAAPVEDDPEYGRDYVTCISVNQNPLYSPFRVPLCEIYGIYRVMMALSEK